MKTNRLNVINAFKLYYSDDNESKADNSKKLEAVKNTIFMLNRIKNGTTMLNAFNDVYIKAASGGGTVTDRVKRHAAETYISESTVYQYLQKVTEIYIKELNLL